MKLTLQKRKLLIFVVSAVVLICGTLLYRHFHDGRGHDIMATPIDKSRYPVTGIDISAHNGIINFEKLAADSIDFVYIKATEGATFQDKNFTDNYRRARKAGLTVGPYHFFRYDSPGHMQAMNLLHSMKGRRFNLPPAIDVEDWTNPRDIPTDTVLARLKEMTDYLQERGYNVIIYTNKKGFSRYFSHKIPAHQLWLCTFTQPEEKHPWTLWQHTHRGRVGGIDGPVDINTFNGDREMWEKWLKNP